MAGASQKRWRTSLLFPGGRQIGRRQCPRQQICAGLLTLGEEPGLVLNDTAQREFDRDLQCYFDRRFAAGHQVAHLYNEAFRHKRCLALADHRFATLQRRIERIADQYTLDGRVSQVGCRQAEYEV